VVQLVERLAAGDAAELLRQAQALEEFAPDHAQVLDELASLLTRIALKQVVKDFDGDDLYAPELLERLARAIPPEDIQLYYQTAIIGRRDLALAPDPRTGFEMVLLRMIAFRPQAGGGEARAPGPPSGSKSAASPPAKASVAPKPVSSTAAPVSALALATDAAPPAARGGTQDWAAIIAATELQGAARQLAAHCVLVGRQGAVVRLALDPRSKFMRTATVEEKLAQALSKYYGEPVRLEFTAVLPQAETPAQADQRISQEEVESARRAFESDPGVQGFRDRFGATMLPETIRPLK
jgi:DNA polymerase-3 subunit gamma/tau